MRTKKMNRYYCDFCTKANSSSGAMRLHERHCTMNPTRTCRMCRSPRDIPALVSTIPPVDNYYTYEGVGEGIKQLATIREQCRGCPACILAVLRQAGLTPRSISFDFTEETKNWPRWGRA